MCHYCEEKEGIQTIVIRWDKELNKRISLEKLDYNTFRINLCEKCLCKRFENEYNMYLFMKKIHDEDKENFYDLKYIAHNRMLESLREFDTKVMEKKSLRKQINKISKQMIVLFDTYQDFSISKSIVDSCGREKLDIFGYVKLMNDEMVDRMATNREILYI